MKKYVIACLLLSSIYFISCKKFLEPNPQGILSETDVINNPAYAEGLLLTAYSNLPSYYNFETDVASDDAVTNDKGSDSRRLATGDWKSSNNPISKWGYCYKQIEYINKFLEIYQSVKWSNDLQLSKEDNERKTNLVKKRLKGEAYALRGWYKWQLLQYHAGKSADGRLLGFPIIDKVILSTDNWKLPRNTFSECVANIFSDLDTALINLPAVWADGSDLIVNESSGKRYENRMNGNTAWAIKSRVALLAASPSFSESNSVSWDEAAKIAGDLLTTLPALYANGVAFYKQRSNSEILWNSSKVLISSWEVDNFSPSLFGKGRTNPSQNLVDAFPMKNGYPINDSASGYNPKNPYLNRDSRLSEYVIFNDATYKSTKINTYVDAAQDGINVLETSTRTGYYLKKLLIETVKLTPGSETTGTHTYTYARMTEVLLNYAEAANEAWGPDGDPNGYGFTARSKIKELRTRAKLTPDAFLNSISNKDDMRVLIHNERRIELCFEGFRFWDIRRWNEQTTLTSPVIGVFITKDVNNKYSYTYNDIEDRIYSPWMIYGPIPYEETLKYNIVQNAGW